MPRGVNEVDQETRTILALLDEGQVVLRELIKQRNGSEREEKMIKVMNCGKAQEYFAPHWVEVVPSALLWLTRLELMTLEIFSNLNAGLQDFLKCIPVR